MDITDSGSSHRDAFCIFDCSRGQQSRLIIGACAFPERFLPQLPLTLTQPATSMLWPVLLLLVMNVNTSDFICMLFGLCTTRLQRLGRGP